MKIRSTDCVNHLVHFFYPSYCLHCDGSLSNKRHLLCAPCFEQIEWIDPKERCIHCFAPEPCAPCKRSPRPLRPHRSLFEGCGPILSLYHHFLKTGQGETLASLLLLALSRSSTPLPDAVVPATLKLFPKKEPSYRLAKALSRLLRRPLLLPSSAVEGKSLLLLIPSLSQVADILEVKSNLKGYFPQQVYSLALIDNRS